MLISHSLRFIFFHVPKTAGISIREALKEYSQEPEKFKINRPPKIKNNKPNPMYEIWQAYLLHAKAKDAKKELSQDIYNSYYKFAFVRNPWDFQVSMYIFLKNMKYKPICEISTFEEYLDWVVKTKNPYPKGATKLQKEILTDDDGNIIVDFIGRYENLQKDFDHVCNVLNISATLPLLNNTVHKEYQSYYNDKTRKIVDDHFKADIQLFDYKFI
ncbi:MAG: sulfotransferase family 2 domain-containing protein [Desulfobacterales bacterium]|nr:sulfotransferase family 2 domain-containing protein [Desulfobacterales bacterium]MBF0395658.1 sulfotransferase family 2 domain-containing protein [Desulfobacterales bacterium]